MRMKLRVGCVIVGFLALVLSLPAQTLTTLHSFVKTDGIESHAGLVQATDGNFYGATVFGGANNYGTIFKITPSGTLTVLHSFASTDGAYPYAGLVQAANGDFYGTAAVGGANLYGTVFKITPSGTLTTLYSFCAVLVNGDCADGSYPYAGLVLATNGDFYGTTGYGGANGDGTVFKITPAGTLTTLYSFCSQSGCTDGESPLLFGALVQATNGDFYGTTEAGGANGDGTVFKITPAGTLTVLHSFASTDGAYPYAGLVLATNGDFYGTTESGGANGYGTVFKITPSGTLTTLHSFASTDGAYPFAGLVQATDGNFYGTTAEGGANDCPGETYACGTVFEVTTNGTLTTLYSFCAVLVNGDCADGDAPYAGLVQATNGTFYGTTALGANSQGGYQDGTVFSLSVGLGPFVETLPTSGKVGTSVKILGNNLKGTTSVSFNGTSAVFKVVSSSLITTTVPTGATTGFVMVTTPSGTLKSNTKFRVTP